jgi:hypothetical protein
MTVKATDSVGLTATTTYNISSAPTLRYSNLTPTSGQVGNTWFQFQVQYRDTQSDIPYSGYPRILLYLGGVLKQEITLFYNDGEISQGATYKGSATINIPGNYTYRIVAYDKWGVPATPLSGIGPDVTGVAEPQLIWTGEPNYTNDGVDPGSNTTGGTFTFKVSYYDPSMYAPAAGYPKVYISINGQILGSWTMDAVWYSSGRGTYTYSTTFATASTDYNYYFEAYNTNTVKAIGTPTNIPAGTFAVTGPNFAPTLSWTGDAGYDTEGVDPDKGAPGTTFNFKVLYRDANNDPGSVTLELTYPNNATSTYQMDPQGTNCAVGVRFICQVPLNTNGTYSHRFLATDIKGSSSVVLGYIGLPEVLEPPQLLWTGTIADGYDNGIEPETGSIATTFVYRVLYKHTKSGASEMKLYITRDGSLYDTISLGGTSSLVATYTYSRSFSQSGNYGYYFSAKDVDGVSAIGSPTFSTSGPVVSAGGGNAPVLSWTDVEGFTDGIEPYVGTVSTPITFMVRYTDANNDPPATGYPKVELRKDGVYYGQYSMDHYDIEDTTFSDGKDYILIMPMGATSINYGYKFIACDTQGMDATGNPTTFRSSPRITEAPILTWSGNTNFTVDGVHPDLGPTGNYRFEVKYTNLYAPYANSPQVHIAIGGREISGSPFVLVQYDPGDTIYGNGKIYYQIVNLTIASNHYTYWFTANNAYSVPGVGTVMNGPAVTGANLAPTLSYHGTGSFTSDCVDPDYGTTGTTFKFRVKYTDQNNHAPQGTPTITVDSTTYLMDSIIEGNLNQAANGIVYEKSISGLAFGNHSHTFNATDTVGAKATALSKTNSPVVNNAPTLSGGTVTSAGSNFTFRVIYTDVDNNAPYSSYPKVHIAIGGKKIGAYPMTQANSNSYSSGRLYSYALNLTIASDDYSYWFEAKDSYQLIASGESTVPISGPIVTGSNIAPQLTSGTVTPYVGTLGTGYIFSVKYTDSNNDEPAVDYPKVVVKRSNGDIIGTYSATSSGTQTPAEGRTYCFDPIDFTGIVRDDYSHYFIVQDVPFNGSALSATTTWVVGPIVTDVPTISGTVTPSAGSIFIFNLEYDKLPSVGYPRVFLKKDGVSVHGSPFLMIYHSGGPPPVYRASIQLTEAGNYTFWFEAKDTKGLKVTTSEQTFTVTAPAPTLPTIVKPQQIEVTTCYNYPNPTYDGNTKIRVELSGTATYKIEINIYDVAGDLVLEIEPKEITDPIYEYPWDGRNGNGRQVANGVYFARCVIDLPDGKRYTKIIKIAVIR